MPTETLIFGESASQVRKMFCLSEVVVGRETGAKLSRPHVSCVFARALRGGLYVLANGAPFFWIKTVAFKRYAQR